MANPIRHYEALNRPEAIQGLLQALDQASDRIRTNPRAGLPAPRPYPGLAAPGEAWVKTGRYWVSYSLTNSPIILTIFHDTADIPGRL